MTAGRLTDAEIADIKARNPVAEIAGRYVSLRPQSGKLVGPCPVCSRDRASRKATRFEIKNEGWVCAVCSDGGDVIKLVGKVEGLDFKGAVEWLGGAQRIDPERAEARDRERVEKDARRKAEAESYRQRERSGLYDVWTRAAPPSGTPVDSYLRLRGIEVPDWSQSAARLRYVADMPYYHGDEMDGSGRKKPRVIHRGPAMVAPVIRGGKFSGLHLTYLDLTQPKGKARILDPDTGEVLPAKKVRGSKSAASIELLKTASGDAPTQIVIGEGIETVLSAWMALKSAGAEIALTEFWSAIDLGNLGGPAVAQISHPTLTTPTGRPQRVPGPDPDLDKPGILIPDSVTDVVLLGDGDSDPVLTQCAMHRAAVRFRAINGARMVRVAWAPRGKDFNDPIGDRAALIRDAKPVKRPIIPPRGDAKKSPTALSPEDGHEPPKPRSRGFDPDRMNKEWALVLMGSKAVVFLEQPKAVFEDRKRFLTLDAFNAWHCNKFTEIVGSDGKIKVVTWAKAWLESPKRRAYRGVEFYPDHDNAPGTDGYLNLWSGFSVTPGDGGWQCYKTFRDHLLNNVCAGNEALFQWVFAFFAHIIQRPRERIGVALVLRGKMGSGKTKVGEVIGSLIAAHYFLVDDARYVTGNFNAHMATCLLLQADEAVWAGDKAAEGRIKGLITSPFQQIEHKGVDPIRLPNYVRLLLTSNENWVVPAGMDERRFAVLDVDPRCAKNFDYFGEMDQELDRGGREALLADLLAFDLDSVDLRTIPKTEALLEQKIASLSPIDSWWFLRLQSGAITRHHSDWADEISTQELYDDYIAAAEKIGVRRKQEETIFGTRLRKLVPQLRKSERERIEETGKRLRWRVYVLPSLERAREHFQEMLGQQVDWDT
jgi:hypothetical protein